jgi:hypothetical protein
LPPRCNFSGASLCNQIRRTAVTAANTPQRRLFVESMCRGKDDCSACRFAKCVETPCENVSMQYEPCFRAVVWLFNTPSTRGVLRNRSTGMLRNRPEAIYEAFKRERCSAPPAPEPWRNWSYWAPRNTQVKPGGVVETMT